MESLSILQNVDCFNLVIPSHDSHQKYITLEALDSTLNLTLSGNDRDDITWLRDSKGNIQFIILGLYKGDVAHAYTTRSVCIGFYHASSNTAYDSVNVPLAVTKTVHHKDKSITVELATPQEEVCGWIMKRGKTIQAGFPPTLDTQMKFFTVLAALHRFFREREVASLRAWLEVPTPEYIRYVLGMERRQEMDEVDHAEETIIKQKLQDVAKAEAMRDLINNVEPIVRHAFGDFNKLIGLPSQILQNIGDNTPVEISIAQLNITVPWDDSLLKRT